MALVEELAGIMVGLFQKLLDNLQDVPEEEPLTAEQLHLASAALLVEVAVADGTVDRQELDALTTILKQRYQLDDESLQELIGMARNQQRQATSLYQFTSLVNQHCNADEKYQLVVALWEIAFIDGNLDKYEEHIIRRIADLIHVSHSNFIRAKLTAQKQ